MLAAVLGETAAVKFQVKFLGLSVLTRTPLL